MACSYFVEAPLISSVLAIALLLLFSPTCSATAGHRSGGGVLQNFEVLDVGAVLEIPSTCSKVEEDGKSKSMKITYTYGPCSPTGGSGSQTMGDMVEMLIQDGRRVANLHRRLSSTNRTTTSSVDELSSKARIPLVSGETIATGGAFLVTVELGTPRTSQIVFFDTGSNTCWVQCLPCATSSSSCYPQEGPLFDPSSSATYRTIPCSSPTCSLPEISGCSTAGSCLYGVEYADGSASVGLLGRDTLTLTAATDGAVPDFVFGCSAAFRGSFGRASGLFGLARDALSLIPQTSGKFGNKFSYCLPSSPSSPGFFKFGAEEQFPTTAGGFVTPMLTDPRDTAFYGLALIGITVAGRRLPIRTTVFSNAGTIIDSGTTLTYLPPAAYSALRSAFRSAMAFAGFFSPFAVSTLDTCYAIGGRSSVPVPVVTLSFTGGSLRLPPINTVLVQQPFFCLAFIGNSGATEISVLGNIQQKGYEIVHDLGLRTIGFSNGNC